jgi:hypothetical protein
MATAGTAVAVLALVGVAVATPTTSTTDVAIVPLTVGHKVLSGATIHANSSASPVVSGGSTTVPTNATTVRVTVLAKGAAAGVLSFYPYGNPSGGSGQTLAYPAGSVAVTGTIQENIGQSNKLTFANAGAGSVVVTATLTGYSTQVTAGDINGTGGTAGQVLTNNGTGGASWESAGAAYGGRSGDAMANPNGVQVASVTVPAGSYTVSFTAGGQDLAATVEEHAACYLLSPDGGISNAISVGLVALSASATQESIAASGLLTTSGGTVIVTCYASTTHIDIRNPSLILTMEGTVSGSVANASRPQTRTLLNATTDTR